MKSLRKIVRRTREKFKSAFNGIRTGLLYDHSILIQFFFAIIAVLFFAMFGIDSIEWLFIISAIFIVLIAEFLNSAIEDVCDLLVKKYNLHVREIKDIAAGAVLLAAIYAVLVGLIIVLRRYI